MGGAQFRHGPQAVREFLGDPDGLPDARVLHVLPDQTAAGDDIQPSLARGHAPSEDLNHRLRIAPPNPLALGHAPAPLSPPASPAPTAPAPRPPADAPRPPRARRR